MINYSDHDIFDLANKRCLTFDPFDDKINEKYIFEKKENLINYLTTLQRGGLDDFKQIYSLKKVKTNNI